MATTAQDLEFNLVTPENLRDPYPLYRRLRESEPVHWSNILHAWVLTRYEDVDAAFRDPRLSANRTRMFVEHQLRGLDAGIAKDYVRACADMMIMKDGAEHARIRKQASHAFTPGRVDQWRPIIRRTMEGLLAPVEARGTRRMDFVADVAEPMPSLVLSELLDIPGQDRGKFQQWSTDASNFFAAATGDIETVARRANEAMVQLEAYMLAALEERRKRPGHDLLSLLLSYEEQGAMSPAELVANAVNILIAGHTTTIDQLSLGVHTFLTHPEALALLREKPELLPSAVEEVLRYLTSVPFMQRIVAEDLELGGKTLRKGQVVFLGLAAANRDPEVFPEPDRFDITRRGRRGIASFGFGPHLCLGSVLARRELESGFELLFQRMPGLRLDEATPPRPEYESLGTRGFYELPLCF